MSEQKYLHPNDNAQEAIVKLCRGNLGALNALVSVFKDRDPGEAVFALVLMDDMNLYGERLYVAWADACHRNTDLLVERLLHRDADLVRQVNETCVWDSTSEIAVTQGASVGPRPLASPELIAEIEAQRLARRNDP